MKEAFHSFWLRSCPCWVANVCGTSITIPSQLPILNVNVTYYFPSPLSPKVDQQSGAQKRSNSPPSLLQNRFFFLKSSQWFFFPVALAKSYLVIVSIIIIRGGKFWPPWFREELLSISNSQCQCDVLFPSPLSSKVDQQRGSNPPSAVLQNQFLFSKSLVIFVDQNLYSNWG